MEVKRLQRQINQASDRRTSVAVAAKSKAILTEATNGSEDICRAGSVKETSFRPLANHCSKSPKGTISESVDVSHLFL